MSDSIFGRGSRLPTRKLGPDTYAVSVSIPTDQAGMLGRECGEDGCFPSYFKVKGGTGIVDDDYDTCFCPYCGWKGEPSDFATEAQGEYAKDVIMADVEQQVSTMIGDAFGLGSSGRRRYGKKSDMFSMEVTHKPGRRRVPRLPFEEELRRDLTCPHCGLEHAVFGLAVWCPDCGRDIFMDHVDAEFEVVRKSLSDVESRRERLGARVAARDVENALEDTVSIFEAVARVLFLQGLSATLSGEEAEDTLRKLGNAFQNLDRAEAEIAKHLRLGLYDGISEEEVEKAKATFEKRHPITHNLGVVDKKYLKKLADDVSLGREVRVSADEVGDAVSFAQRVLVGLHGQVRGKSSEDE